MRRAGCPGTGAGVASKFPQITTTGESAMAIRISAWLLVAIVLTTPFATAEAFDIVVGTTSDTGSIADGACSLREAIIASNGDRSGDVTAPDCLGLGIDSITFARG